MNACNTKSLACIAGAAQQLLQMPLLVLLKMYCEVMTTLVALVMIILHILYTVAFVNVKLMWSFFTHQSYVLMAGLTTRDFYDNL